VEAAATAGGAQASPVASQGRLPLSGANGLQDAV
jgi:hypothetical protein